VEQYEASSEELKASNEELQAMNEELRAATEELQTSREELQSINEELATVNHELKNKVEQLSHANSDLQNLMDATQIATIFLDRNLRIMRFTPAAVRLFNLIPTDLGRPLSDMGTQLDYPELGDDAMRVLQRLVPIEREVGQPDGTWYLARLIPYRTADDRIAGVVFTFIDITERKRAEEVRLWLSAVVSASSDAIISFALDETILSWNAGAQKLFGYGPEEAIGQPLSMLSAGDPADTEHLLAEVAAGRGLANVETVRRRKDGSTVHVAMTVSPVRESDGRVQAATAIARDFTAVRAAAEALRQSEERLRLIMENAREYAIFSLDLERRVTSWNAGAQRLLGYAQEEVLGRSGDMLFTAEDQAARAPEKEAVLARQEGRAADDRTHVRQDGTRFPANGVLMLMRNDAGDAVGFVKILRDLSRDIPRPKD
jgi:two-component system CheB/CheR fusion protein